MLCYFTKHMQHTRTHTHICYSFKHISIWKQFQNKKGSPPNVYTTPVESPWQWTPAKDDTNCKNPCFDLKPQRVQQQQQSPTPAGFFFLLLFVVLCICVFVCSKKHKAQKKKICVTKRMKPTIITYKTLKMRICAIY